MKITCKGIVITLLIVAGLPLLALAGLWRMGLLPLLLYNTTGGGAGLLQIMEGTTGKTAPVIPGETAIPGKTPGASPATPGETPSPGTLNRFLNLYRQGTKLSL